MSEGNKCYQQIGEFVMGYLIGIPMSIIVVALLGGRWLEIIVDFFYSRKGKEASSGIMRNSIQTSKS